MAQLVQIQVRRDTAANWASSNPVLAAGELGIETDTGLMRYGDGSTAWSSITLRFERAPTSAWQTYTPNVSNAVHISIDWNAGIKWKLNPPVDNLQPVDLPLNLPDGKEMQWNLIGGGASGSWVPVWDPASPNTPGWNLPGGAAPASPPSATSAQRLFIERVGARYEVNAGGIVPA